MVNPPRDIEKDPEQQQNQSATPESQNISYSIIGCGEELGEISLSAERVQNEAAVTVYEPSRTNVVPETRKSLCEFCLSLINRICNGILQGVNYVIAKISFCFSQEPFEIEDVRELEPFTEPTKYAISPDFKIKPATAHGTHATLGVYSMQHKRGVLFFVNIINFRYDVKSKKREGAEHDRDNLVTLFRELGYEVFYYEDLTQKQFVDVLSELVNSDYLHNIDSFVMCIQSHGNMFDINGKERSEFSQTLIQFHDGRTLGIEQIVKKFSNQDCQSLATKPKVFLFPCCRGTETDLIQTFRLERHPQDGQIQTDSLSKCVYVDMPTYSDILICYSTLPGFGAYRYPSTGSWYITELCKVIAEHAHNCHIEDLLKILSESVVNKNKITGKAQVASTEARGFTKLMYFNPKI